MYIDVKSPQGVINKVFIYLLPVGCLPEILPRHLDLMMCFSVVFVDIPLQLHFGALLKRGGFEKRTKPQALRNTQVVEKK